MSGQLDVISVGNAIVDVLAHCDDAFLTDNDIIKGGMTLIGARQALEIYRRMGDTVEVAGGSNANAMACLASLGGKAGFIGKVGQDRLGDVFRNSLHKDGIIFATAPMEDQTPTGRCLINITPDAERSMMTFIGAAEHVSVQDISPDFIATGKVIFFEGYLFEQLMPREAMVMACAAARDAGRKTALTLSDKGCVERQHGAYISFIRDHCDILFANEAEALALSRTGTLTAAITELKPLAPWLVVTRSGKGSVICGPDGEEAEIAAISPDELVDTTGAGDAYAGGFLYGFTRDLPLGECGRIGAVAASEVISHMGPRPETALSTLI